MAINLYTKIIKQTLYKGISKTSIRNVITLTSSVHNQEETNITTNIEQNETKQSNSTLGFGLQRKMNRQKFINLFNKTLLPPTKNNQDYYDLYSNDTKEYLNREDFEWLKEQIKFIEVQNSNDKIQLIEKLFDKIKQDNFNLPKFPGMIKYMINHYFKTKEYNIVEEIFSLYSTCLYHHLNETNINQIPDHINNKYTNLIILNMIKLYTELKDLDKLTAINEVIKAISLQMSGKLDATLSIAYLSLAQYELSKLYLLRSLQKKQSICTIDLLNVLLYKGIKNQHNEAKEYLNWIIGYMDFLFPPSNIPGKNINIRSLDHRIELAEDKIQLFKLIELADQITLLKNKTVQLKIINKLITFKDIDIIQLLGVYRRFQLAKIKFNSSQQVISPVDHKVIKVIIKACCKNNNVIAAIKLAQPLIQNEQLINQKQKDSIVLDILNSFINSNSNTNTYPNEFNAQFRKFLYEVYHFKNQWNVPVNHLLPLLKTLGKLKQHNWIDKLLTKYHKDIELDKLEKLELKS